MFLLQKKINRTLYTWTVRSIKIVECLLPALFLLQRQVNRILPGLYLSRRMVPYPNKVRKTLPGQLLL
jgi:hypothetical protein